MKTQALKQALDQHGFDAAIGGARRDEEKSRAKERIFSFRSAQHRWDPKQQRPELWNLYNTRIHKGESVRVFPLSNWTELDVWLYIYREEIPVPSLYFAARTSGGRARRRADPGRRRAPAAARGRDAAAAAGALPHARLLSADRRDRIARPTRWRRSSPRCWWPRTSERQGRVIDHDPTASMEKKKQEGYF